MNPIGFASSGSTTPTSLDNLAATLNGGKLAMGDPDSVPAGRYGKAALDSLKQWSTLEPSVVRAKDVRARHPRRLMAWSPDA